MKVLTLHQPWASLVALGVKTIETRSWSTQYRGPLAIHAGARQPRHAFQVGQWRCYAADGRAAPHPAPPRMYGPDDIANTSPRYAVLPLGAIVATCTLVDVVPIGGTFDFSTGSVEGEECPTAGLDVVVNHQHLGGLVLDRWGGASQDITDQRPYGDFTPGRFAWLLADVVPVDPPVPFKGGQGLTKTWEAA